MFADELLIINEKGKTAVQLPEALKISEQGIMQNTKMVCFLLLSMRVLGIILKIIHFLKLVFPKEITFVQNTSLMEKKTGFVLLMAL